jgi:hypothetical protein
MQERTPEVQVRAFDGSIISVEKDYVAHEAAERNRGRETPGANLSQMMRDFTWP